MGNSPRLIVLSGPSGIGKSTLISKLTTTGHVSFVVPFTTRNPRTDEQDGRDYHFVDRSQFHRMIIEGRMTSWDYTLRNYYGFDNSLQSATGVTHSLARMALRVRRQISNAVLIFLQPVNREAHFARLKMRFPDPIEFGLRSAHYEEELAHSSLFDHTLTVSGADDALKPECLQFWRWLGLDLPHEVL